MRRTDRIVVTGGASRIGRALARRFTSKGARRVVVVDNDADGARRVAAEVGGTAVPADDDRWLRGMRTLQACFPDVSQAG